MEFIFENRNTLQRFKTDEPYNHLVNPNLQLISYKFDHVGDLEEFCFKSYIEETVSDITAILYEDWEKVGLMVMDIIENDPMITDKEKYMEQWFGSCYEQFRGYESIYMGMG